LTAADKTDHASPASPAPSSSSGSELEDQQDVHAQMLYLLGNAISNTYASYGSLPTGDLTNALHVLEANGGSLASSYENLPVVASVKSGVDDYSSDGTPLRWGTFNLDDDGFEWDPSFVGRTSDAILDKKEEVLVTWIIPAIGTWLIVTLIICCCRCFCWFVKLSIAWVYDVFAHLKTLFYNHFYLLRLPLLALSCPFYLPILSCSHTSKGDQNTAGNHPKETGVTSGMLASSDHGSAGGEGAHGAHDRQWRERRWNPRMQSPPDRSHDTSSWFTSVSSEKLSIKNAQISEV
jgi:hypothetical protein